MQPGPPGHWEEQKGPSPKPKGGRLLSPGPRGHTAHLLPIQLRLLALFQYLPSASWSQKAGTQANESVAPRAVPLLVSLPSSTTAIGCR